jgi:2-hydroxychromene-2-carboxylate isomerase
MAANAAPVVDFYLDTACPWSWRTSVWMREVMKVRDVDVHWKFFSLEEINRANNPDMEPRPGHLQSRNVFRTMVLARRKFGEDAVNKLYHEFGTARHEEKKELDDDTIRLCIEKAGLAPSLLDEALADDSTRDEYLAEHKAAAEQGAFGVATLMINGSEPVFGPVIIPVPQGEEAGELWDHVAAMSTKGYFFELKRTRH